MAVAPKAGLILAVSYSLTAILSRYAPQLLPDHSILNSTLLFFTLLFSLWAIYAVVVYPRYLSPLRYLPTATGASLIFGHFITLFKEPSGEPQRRWNQEQLNDGLLRYYWLFNIERVIPTSPKALAEVLVSKNYEFIKPTSIREGLGQLLGVGILLAEGDEHKRQRRLMMPAFAFRHIKDLYPVFWSKGTESVRAMSAELTKQPTSQENQPPIIEIGEWASRTTLDIIGLAGMGQDFNAIQDPNNELNKTYRHMFKPSRAGQLLGLASIFLPRWLMRALPVKRKYEVEEARLKIRAVCQQLIEHKRAKMEKNTRTDVDILSVLLESGGFSDEDVINQMMTFLAAGHETTATAMLWAVYLLCQNPEVQTRLREEIRQNLPSISEGSTTVTSTDVDRLQYLSAVCNETLRLIPPVSLTLRVTAADTTILGQQIPKGTNIIIVPQVVNCNKSLWGEDADKFNPDRWLAEGKANSGGAESNYAYLTFLHGPRSCIGQSFAKAEFACILATWVGRWEMELADPNRKLEITGGLTAKPKGGLPVKLKDVKGW